MSLDLYNNCMPTDFFSRQTLELSFRLLHAPHPLLAHAIKNTLDTIKTIPFGELHSTYTDEMLSNTELLTSLKAQTIGKIVSALTEIGQGALHKQDLPAEHLRLLRNLIEDWVQLTEWILTHSSPDQFDKTFYQ